MTKIVAEYDRPKDAEEFYHLEYPIDYVDLFHKIGESEGTSGTMPCAKYKSKGKEFIAYACYGTLEHPRKEMMYMTFIINKMFDSKGFDDYKIHTTQEDLDERARRIDDIFKDCKFVLLDMSDLIK